jgi:hypothetical protein
MPNVQIPSPEWTRYETDRLLAFLRAHERPVPDRRALPPDGPDIGSDVPGGGAV